MSDSSTPDNRLSDPPYMAFPFRVGTERPELARRQEHIRGQIEQVLFTAPGERVFRPDFGAGVKTLIFEPNRTPLWEITRRRILSSLADALHGEIDPSSLEVDASGDEERVLIVIRYRLAAIGVSQTQRFVMSGGQGGQNGGENG